MYMFYTADWSIPQIYHNSFTPIHRGIWAQRQTKTGHTNKCNQHKIICCHFVHFCVELNVQTVYHNRHTHYCDAIMGTLASQITSLTIVYTTVYSDADQSKHQSSASLAFVWGIHRGPVNSPHNWPVTRKMSPFDDVIMPHPHPYSPSQASRITSNRFGGIIIL